MARVALNVAHYVLVVVLVRHGLVIKVAWQVSGFLVDLVQQLFVLAVGSSRGVDLAVSRLLELLMDDVLLLLARTLKLA